MVRARGLAAATVIAACGGGDPLVIAPVIESPAPGTEAAAFPDLDELTLSIARAGDPAELVSATFTRGDLVELSGVPLGDDLVIHLVGRAGGSEVAYGRTCTFAVVEGEPAPQPHLYFARTVRWGDRQSLPAAERLGGVALTAADGSAVFIGGETAASIPVVALDHVDPRSGAVTTAATLSPRRYGVAGLLGDGRIVVAGGIDPATDRASAAVEVVDLDDAPERRVDRFEDPRLARAGAALTALSDGALLVVGGGEVAGPPLATLVEVRADGAALSLREVRATLAVPRLGASATRLSDQLGAPVLIAGGRDATGALIDVAELYKPLNESFADPATFRPTMRVPRSGHVAVRLPDGSVLIAGGVDAFGRGVRVLELFSLDAGFRDAGLLPEAAGVIDLSATPLPDGRVLLAGGRVGTSSPPTGNAHIARLDPLDGSVDVVPTDDLGAARAGHAAAILCDGTIVIAGGTDGAPPVERYQPPPGGRR